MSQESQADVFIKALAEMLEDDHRRLKARLRAQNKIHLERFRRTAFAEDAGGGSSAEWSGTGRQTPQHAIQRMLDQ